MKYSNGVDKVRAMQWKGESSKFELMQFTGESYLAMMGSNDDMKVFVDDIDGDSFIVCQGDYVLGNREDGFTKMTEPEFQSKYSDYNTIIVEVAR